MPQDEKVKCVDCPNHFWYTAKDQVYYKEKGFEPPKRCRSCREKKKQRFAKYEKQ